MGIIRIIIEIIVGIVILVGINNSFKMEGEEKITEIIGTVVLIIIEILLIGG